MSPPFSEMALKQDAQANEITSFAHRKAPDSLLLAFTPRRKPDYGIGEILRRSSKRVRSHGCREPPGSPSIQRLSRRVRRESRVYMRARSWATPVFGTERSK